MEYDVSNIDRLEVRIICPRDVGDLEEFLNCGKHSRDRVAQVVNCFLHDVLSFKELVRYQPIVVLFQMSEYARHSAITRVCRHVADIWQVSCLDCAKDLLEESLLHSLNLTEQAHFLSVRNPHIGVCVGSRAVRNDDRTPVSWVNKRSG